jgi:hypothetical protein
MLIYIYPSRVSLITQQFTLLAAVFRLWIITWSYKERFTSLTADKDDIEMVQTYGVASTGNLDSDLNDDHVDEARALLGSNSSGVGAFLKKKDGHATLVSSISNLLNTIIGSGML